jgi:hypothetical protein
MELFPHSHMIDKWFAKTRQKRSQGEKKVEDIKN